MILAKRLYVSVIDRVIEDSMDLLSEANAGRG